MLVCRRVNCVPLGSIRMQWVRRYALIALLASISVLLGVTMLQTVSTALLASISVLLGVTMLQTVSTALLGDS